MSRVVNEKGAHYQQPMANQGMSVSHLIQNPQNVALNPDGKRNWSNDLCSCNCSDYCMSFCCSCIVFSKNEQRTLYMTKNGNAIPENELSSCTGMCFLYSCLPQQLILTFSRIKTRERYNINGSCCGDLCVSHWCFPCALSQETAEIRAEEDAMRARHQGQHV